MLWEALKTKRAWVGLDGFIDHIVKAVKLRYGSGEQFEAYERLTEFGQKIQSASGANLNIEFFPKLEKMGGNGPLLANALVQMSIQVHYTGLLGEPIHPLFTDFSDKAHALSLGPYGETTAVEFNDGKLILGKTFPLEAITYERWIDAMPEHALVDLYSETDLISFQNWTMTLHMNSILEKVLKRIWPHIKNNKERIIFFDLADPAKRSTKEVQDLLMLLPQFRSKAHVYLALNQSEIRYVAQLLQQSYPDAAWHSQTFFTWLQALKKQLHIDGVILHSHQGAVAACEEQIGFSPIQPARQFTCLTGSGDHFNGGFLCGCLMHLPLEKCLYLGHSLAVRYIETGKTPTLETMRPILEELEREEV